jgi:hypothetical protein
MIRTYIIVDAYENGDLDGTLACVKEAREEMGTWDRFKHDRCLSVINQIGGGKYTRMYNELVEEYEV